MADDTNRDDVPLDRAHEFEEPVADEFLSAVERKEWADERHPFYITSITRRAGRFEADEWVYGIDDGVLTRRLSLTVNPQRDKEARGQLAALSLGSRLGPAYLVAAPMKGGKTTWVFKSGAATTPPSQDDIPF